MSVLYIYIKIKIIMRVSIYGSVFLCLPGQFEVPGGKTGQSLDSAVRSMTWWSVSWDHMWPDSLFQWSFSFTTIKSKVIRWTV